MSRSTTDAQPPVIRKLQSWQAKLLDLSRANRLLYARPTKSSSTPIVFPEPEKLFHQIVVQGKTLTFPIDEDKELFDLDGVDDVEVKVVTPRRYKNGEIGSPLADQKLSRVLYNLRARARSALEEKASMFSFSHWVCCTGMSRLAVSRFNPPFCWCQFR